VHTCFYNVLSDVLMNAEASVCGERVTAGQRRLDAAADSNTCEADRQYAVEEM
jgi:hypothetical protein